MTNYIKKFKEEIIVSAVFLFFALGFNVYRIQGDGVLYYKFLERILSISHPEYPHAEVAKAFFFQSGCAFFNAPFYLAAYLIERLLHLHFNLNGITLRQIAVNISSNFYIVLALILTIQILKKLQLRNRILPALSILFSTSAFAASVVFPSFNHSVDIFITTAYLYLFLSYKDEKPARTIFLGILTTIALMIRYFNFVFLFPVIFYYFREKKMYHLKYFILGFLCSFWILPLLLHTFNGSASPFYHTAYNAALSTKAPWQHVNFIPKYSLKFLIHPLHGLFVWSPVTILSFIGLLFAPQSKQKEGYVFLSMFCLYLFFLGFIEKWYAGWSFSNRYLVSFFPIYVAGLSFFLEKQRKKFLFLAIALTAYSIILYVNWHLCIINAEFSTPWSALQAWIKGESDSFSEKSVSLKIIINALWERCRYKYLFIVVN